MTWYQPKGMNRPGGPVWEIEAGRVDLMMVDRHGTGRVMLVSQLR